jgi:hypothetical protein
LSKEIGNHFEPNRKTDHAKLSAGIEAGPLNYY